jgi:hypothetical protein
MKGLLAAVSRIAAILPNDLAPTNMNGPLLPLNCLPSCRGAALRTGLSLQLQNSRWANSHNADEVAFHETLKSDLNLQSRGRRSGHALGGSIATPKIMRVEGPRSLGVRFSSIYFCAWRSAGFCSPRGKSPNSQRLPKVLNYLISLGFLAPPAGIEWITKYNKNNSLVGNLK